MPRFSTRPTPFSLRLAQARPYKRLPPGNYPGNMHEIVQVGCWNMHLHSIEMMYGFS